VLTHPEASQQLETRYPGVVAYFENWLREQLVADLYHYGNHFDWRLNIALVVLRRLRRSGGWDDLIRHTYRERCFDYRAAPWDDGVIA
jgi:hypothetical protein